MVHEVRGRQELLEEALAHLWYHTIDVAPGVATAGAVDLRGPASKLLPARLDGLRALDVGTFDGFWAFELERRGAQTIAADLPSVADVEIPPPQRERIMEQASGWRLGERFRIAASLLDSKVRRVECSIYDLDPARLDGQVDVAVLGDVLLHLRDPVRGLERVRAVLQPGGRLFLCEQFSPVLTILRPRTAAASLQALSTDFNWWVANARCIRDWLTLAGFRGCERRLVTRVRGARHRRNWHIGLEATA